MRLERRADHRAEGEVGHVMVVHHVEVDPVGAGGDHVAHLLAQAGEVGGEDGGGDADRCVLMARLSQSCRPPRVTHSRHGQVPVPRRSRARIPAGAVRAGAGRLQLRLHHHHHQHRRSAGAADLAPLGHHRRAPATSRRSRAWAWSGSSRCSSPASPSSTPAAAACARPAAPCRAATSAWPRTASASRSQIAALRAGRRQPPRAALSASASRPSHCRALSYKLSHDASNPSRWHA